MISFKIEHPSLQGDVIETTLFWSKFYIGSQDKCHLRVITETLDKYLLATQSTDGFFIKSLSDYSFILNGKKYLGKKRCHNGDIIKIDNTTITITELDLEQINEELDYSKDSINQDPYFDEIMSVLKKELIYSHKDF